MTNWRQSMAKGLGDAVDVLLVLKARYPALD